MITAKYNPDGSTETCTVTGKKFYQRQGLCFYLDGDMTKPVKPKVALKAGFTISLDLLKEASTQLVHAREIEQKPVFDD